MFWGLGFKVLTSLCGNENLNLKVFYPPSGEVSEGRRGVMGVTQRRMENLHAVRIKLLALGQAAAGFRFLPV